MKSLVLAAIGLIGLESTGWLHPPDYDFDWATIGDEGNDALFGGPEGEFPWHFGGHGRVDYEYRISRLEITTGQWLEFVNTFAMQEATERLIRHPGVWGAQFDNTYDGPGRRYELIDHPDAARRAVSGPTWEEAARYANWLHHGKPTDASLLEHGAYDTSTWGTNPDGTSTAAPSHEPGARYCIPTLDEWLKAGYWDPNKDGIGGWWLYPNGTDEPLTPGLPEDGGETMAGARIGSDAWLVPLGAYGDVTSPWGLLDVSGGATEWLEDFMPGLPPVERLFAGSNALGSGYDDLVYRFGSSDPFLGATGLRLASAVPAPHTPLLMMGLLSWATRRRR